MRGHFVFFDRDQLPAADSFDERISRAISISDIMIFLVSPDAVAPGRYTLTELVFARKKWPSAKGRVFPVLTLPTPNETIPGYLKSIQFLTTEGNVAAEVAAVVDEIIPTAQPSRILPVAILLGVISGTISAFVPIIVPVDTSAIDEALRLPFTLSLLAWSAPYVFSIVVAVLLIVWDKVARTRVLLVLPIIMVAWICAFITEAKVENGLGGNPIGYHAPDPAQCESVDDDTDSPKQLKELCRELRKYREEIEPKFGVQNTLSVLFAGLSAGFVGSLLTIIGLGRISLRLRTLEAIIAAISIGTAAGGLLIFGRSVFHWPMFMVWQAGVATAIAWRFTYPAPKELDR